MSEIEVHTNDPINPAKATAVTPRTSSAPQNSSSLQPTATATASHGYPAAQPGQAAPLPTKIAPIASATGPAPPQPGAVPQPPAPAVTAKATLPPPPKAGEKVLPPEAYTIRHTTAAPPATTQTLPYPSQMSQSLQDTPGSGVPPSSTTSTTNQPSFTPLTGVSSFSNRPPTSSVNLQHPPGYVQNERATELTPDQRHAIRQEELKNQSLSDAIGYSGDPNQAFGNPNTAAAGMWESAKALAGQVGQKAGELHTDIWKRINEEK